MTNKTLGTLALMGAPSMYWGMYVEQHYNLTDSWFTGVWGLIYITAWMASILALQRMKATGETQFGKRIIRVIMGTLILANISNIYQLIAPTDKSTLFFVLDSFWPLSNLVMLAVGIASIRAKVLSGWKRFVPVVAGVWFPLAALSMVLFGRDPVVLMLFSLYTAIAWSLLAIVAITSKEPFSNPGYQLTKG